MRTKAMPASGVLAGKHGNGDWATNVSTSKYSTFVPTTQPPSPMLAWALRYALAGWRVLPLAPGGKAPAIPAAHPEGDPRRGKCTGECGKPGHGVYDATDDPETIGAWWRKWPAANIGLALGNDVVVLDVDPRNGGRLEHLDALDLDPAQTSTQRTAGGGWHVIYEKPAGIPFVSHVPRLDGLDVLTGGYIVAAPSVVAGNRYQWERDPIDTPPARIPLHVAERLQARQKPVDGPTAPDGGKHGIHDLADVERMLAHLDPWGTNYDGWVRRLMAVHSEFPGEDGLALAEAWADGKPGEVRGKWRSFDASGGVTLGTLVRQARLCGWKPAGDVDDTEVPEQWRITSEDWKSCPLCAALYTEEFSDGTVRTFHRWCRKPSCKVYRKIKARRHLGPVFKWLGVQSEIVLADDWRQWREDAKHRLGDKWRGIPVGDNYLAIYESPDGDNLDQTLEMAAAAILEKRRGRNVSAPRRRRNLADGPRPAPDPRPKPVRQILVSTFRQRRQILSILDKLKIPWERERLGGWRTGALPELQRVALRTALVFGVKGGRPLNCALGSTDELHQDALAAVWGEPLPHSVEEYRLDGVRRRYKTQVEVQESP